LAADPMNDLLGKPSEKAKDMVDQDKKSGRLDDIPETLVIPTIPELVQMAKKVKELVIPHGQMNYKVTIRALTYGELQDAYIVGDSNISLFRQVLVFKGLVEPAAKDIVDIQKMPYTLIKTIAMEVEKLSKATGEVKKKS
jgi:hypothetical protein